MDESSEDSGFEDAHDDQSRFRLNKPTERVVMESPALPPLPLSGFQHSLVPDMVLGWRPRLTGGPIPLLFNCSSLPTSLSPITKREYPTVFYGFRPCDSQEMHETLAVNYAKPHYPALDAFRYLQQRDPRYRDTRPFQGMASGCDLQFDSTFESGNLDRAVQVGPDEFELYMRADANTRGHYQWYYFSVTVGTARTVRFHLLNFTKNESLYSQGLLPVVFVEAQPHLSWHHAGLDVRYGPSKINRPQRRTYFSLSFSYAFQQLGKVYFAYAVPYCYSFLRSSLTQLSTQECLRSDVLCKSLSGVDVPVLTITNFQSGTAKPHIVMMGRIHPGETHGSWVLHGLIGFLLSAHPAATALRDKVVFVIVPMVNPDGVIMGNYRTGFSGSDLNRQFLSPDPQLHPIVVAIKAMVAQVARTHKLLAFLDFHAHSKKKYIFLYGPRYPLHEQKYYAVRVLPKLICERGPYFRYVACKFTAEACKQTTARLVLWRELKVTNSFTVEASLYGYLNAERTTVAFTSECLERAGSDVALALHQYFQLWEEEQRQLERRSALKQVIEQLKQEAKGSSSSDSDSLSSQDELLDEEKRHLRGQILAALQRQAYPALRPFQPSSSQSVLKKRPPSVLSALRSSKAVRVSSQRQEAPRPLLKVRKQLKSAKQLRSLSCSRLRGSK